MEEFDDNEIKMNNIQNINLYNKIKNNNNYDNLNNLNFESSIGFNRSNYNYNNNKNNLINIDENAEPTFGNNNIIDNRNNFDFRNNYNYNINSTYVDTKEEGQKRNLNNFRMLLNKMEEKI